MVCYCSIKKNKDNNEVIKKRNVVVVENGLVISLSIRGMVVSSKGT